MRGVSLAKTLLPILPRILSKYRAVRLSILMIMVLFQEPVVLARLAVKYQDLTWLFSNATAKMLLPPTWWFQFCHVMQFSPLHSLPPKDSVCYNGVQSTLFDKNIGDGHNIWVVKCLFWRLSVRRGGLNISVEGWHGVSGREGSQVMEQHALWSDMSDYIEV